MAEQSVAAQAAREALVASGIEDETILEADSDLSSAEAAMDLAKDAYGTAQEERFPHTRETAQPNSRVKGPRSARLEGPAGSRAGTISHASARPR